MKNLMKISTFKKMKQFKILGIQKIKEFKEIYTKIKSVKDI